MEKFCKSKNVKDLSLKKKDKENLQELVEGIQKLKKFKIPKNNVDFFYTLQTYLNPAKITEDIEYKKFLERPNYKDICGFYASKSLSDHLIKRLFFTFYNKACEIGIKTDVSNISESYLLKLYKIWNKIYFDDKFLETSKNISLKFKLSNRMTKTAGYCSYRGCNYTVTMAAFIGKKLNNLGITVANGVKCRNGLQCFLLIFQHELIHLLNAIYCVEAIKTYGGHGSIFRDIVKNIYGHTEYKHNIGVDMEVAGVSKKDLVGRRAVSWSYDGESHKAFIVKLNPKRVRVITFENVESGSRRYWNTPYAIIHKDEPEFDEKLFKKFEDMK